MFKIFSQYECLIKSQEGSILLTQNENLEIDSSQVLNIYPTSSRRISFTIDLQKLTPSAFYKIKKTNSDIFIFIIDTCLVKNEEKYVFSSPVYCEISVSKTEVSFDLKDIRKTLSLNFDYDNYSIKKNKNLYICQFESFNKSYVIIFNPKTYAIKTFCGNIENLSDGFIVHEEYFDIHYIFDQSGLKIKKYSMIKKIPSSLLAFQFMNAIKLQCYSLAFSLLSEDLKEKITITQLKDFLPKVDYFKFVKDNICFAHSSQKDTFLAFETTNDGIKEINDD